MQKGEHAVMKAEAQFNECLATDQNEYHAIDIAKFVCAILVISIHISPFGPDNNYILTLLNFGVQHCLARIAVPLFFVASGFFLYRKTSLEEFSFKPTKAYIIKIFKLYLIWTIIYFPLKYGSIIEDKKGVAHGILIYIRNFIFKGSYTQLWYCPALIFSVSIVSYMLLKKIKIKWILIVSGFFYFIGLLTQSWNGIVKPLKDVIPQLWEVFGIIKGVIVTTRNGLFFGFLFVAIGAYFAFYGFKMQQNIAILGFIVCYVLLFCECFMIRHFRLALERNMYFFLVPLTYFAFGLLLNVRVSGNDMVFKNLRIVSSLIFYCHLWVRWLIIKVFSHYGLQIKQSFLLFVLTVILSIVCSFMIFKLSECSGFKWLKKLYKI